VVKSRFSNVAVIRHANGDAYKKVRLPENLGPPLRFAMENLAYSE
jgi:hypothetical protein